MKSERLFRAETAGMAEDAKMLLLRRIFLFEF